MFSSTPSTVTPEPVAKSRRTTLALRFYRRLPGVLRVPVATASRRVGKLSKVKVSVIIAAYNSDQVGLNRVIGSLVRQTLPLRSFEIIFVDDGSTDDTRKRLDAFARRIPNIEVRTISNSGWASRPRNVGVEMARGEYVLFMDHDDELFPYALQRAYDFGKRNDADVVNAKEVRSTGWAWGWDSFRTDVPHAAADDVMGLIPMTPHKLYRRSFVRREGVRFPEGARALWEDIHYNTAALAKRPRVAVLAHSPFYHWVVTGANTSRTFGRDFTELWRNVSGLFDLFERELAGHPARWPLVAHTLRGRVCRTVGPLSLPRSPEYLDAMYPAVQRIVAAHAPSDRDADFSPVDRCRLELIRIGDPQLQRKLAEVDDGVTSHPVVDDVRWEDGELVVTASAALLDQDGEPVRVRRDGDRWMRDLPEALGSRLSAAAIDVTDWLARATFDITVKGRSSRSNWCITETGHVECIDDGSGGGVVSASATARFDPNRFAKAHDVDDPVWDFAARLATFGYVTHRGLRGGSPAVALVDGTQAIGYTNKSGLYSLDVSASVRSVTGSAPPRPGSVDVKTRRRSEPAGGQTVDVRIPLPDVHCAGVTRLRGTVLLGDDRRAAATLTGGPQGAEIAFRADAPHGDFVLRTEFLGRRGSTGLVLSVSRGQARVRATRPVGPHPV